MSDDEKQAERIARNNPPDIIERLGCQIDCSIDNFIVNLKSICAESKYADVYGNDNKGLVNYAGFLFFGYTNPSVSIAADRYKNNIDIEIDRYKQDDATIVFMEFLRDWVSQTYQVMMERRRTKPLSLDDYKNEI